MPAASQSDTAEIQTGRTVSEDSDSEGAMLFQPVEFREHVQVWQVMHQSSRHVTMRGVWWTGYVCFVFLHGCCILSASFLSGASQTQVVKSARPEGVKHLGEALECNQIEKAATSVKRVWSIHCSI